MCKTLIIDHDVNSSRALHRLVSLQGHEAYCAMSLAQAVDQMASCCPDRILVELMLPDGSGADLLRRVRQLELPVRVAVMAGRRRDVTKELHSMGPDLILEKPIDIVQLIRWLREPLDPAEVNRATVSV
jgi:DNA-binding response OmpR family regulator